MRVRNESTVDLQSILPFPDPRIKMLDDLDVVESRSHRVFSKRIGQAG